MIPVGHLFRSSPVALPFSHPTDLSSSCRIGATALHRAISSNKFETVKELLNLGADVHATTKIGESFSFLYLPLVFFLGLFYPHTNLFSFASAVANTHTLYIYHPCSSHFSYLPLCYRSNPSPHRRLCRIPRADQAPP